MGPKTETLAVDTKASEPSSSVLHHSQLNLADEIMNCWLYVPIALFQSMFIEHIYVTCLHGFPGMFNHRAPLS